jgi:hypothetical protein
MGLALNKMGSEINVEWLGSLALASSSPLPQHPPLDHPVNGTGLSPIGHLCGVSGARGNGTGRRRCVRLLFVGDGRNLGDGATGDRLTLNMYSPAS